MLWGEKCPEYPLGEIFLMKQPQKLPVKPGTTHTHTHTHTSPLGPVLKASLWLSSGDNRVRPSLDGVLESHLHCFLHFPGASGGGRSHRKGLSSQAALSVGMKSNGALGKREISGSVFQPHGLFYGLSCPYA